MVQRTRSTARQGETGRLDELPPDDLIVDPFAEQKEPSGLGVKLPVGDTPETLARYGYDIVEPGGKVVKHVPPETETRKNIFERIADVMGYVEYIQKEKPKGNLNFFILTSSAVLAQIRPALIRAGIVVVPGEITRFDKSTIRVGAKQTENVLIDMVQEFRIQSKDDPTDFVKAQSAGSGCDTMDKAFAKALTMTEKNMLVKLFLLESGEDHPDDRVGLDDDGAVDNSVDYISTADAEEIIDMCKEARVDVQLVAESYHAQTIYDVAAADVPAIFKRLEAKLQSKGSK